MKSWIYTSIIFMGFFMLVACGAEATEDHGNEQISTTIAGGRVGGAWSVFSEGIAESIRREHEDAYVTVEPGSIIENPVIVSQGNVPYGLSYAMTASSAFQGEDPYDEAYGNIRAVSVVIPANYYQLLTPNDASFDSIEKIIENEAAVRLAVDQQGSIGELITREIFASYGLTYDDLISWGGSVDYLAGSKAFEMMADGRIDITGDAESAPSSNILEAATTIDLNMLSLDEATIQALEGEFGVERNTIPKDTYDFLDRDIKTVSTPAILIVNKDVPEKEVYEVTKSIYNNLEYLHTVHGEFQNLTKETMANVGDVPLHPGAEKFFKEKGILE